MLKEHVVEREKAMAMAIQTAAESPNKGKGKHTKATKKSSSPAAATAVSTTTTTTTTTTTPDAPLTMDISIMDICDRTSICAADALLALDMLELLQVVPTSQIELGDRDRDRDGSNGSRGKDKDKDKDNNNLETGNNNNPAPTAMVLNCTTALLDELLLKFPANGLSCDPENLHWRPLYVTDPKKDRWAITTKGLTKASV